MGGDHAPVGQQLFDNVSGTFTVPAGCFSISAVCIGRGGAGATGGENGCGGAGLAYISSLAVTPGEILTITIDNFYAGLATAEGHYMRGYSPNAGSPSGAPGTLSGARFSSAVTRTGGNGGNNFGGGGGGCAGYGGNGGNGHGSVVPTAGAGGGGGGGYGSSGSDGGGGGTGIYGQGANGAAGTSGSKGGKAGSGGGDGGTPAGGAYGGGAGANSSVTTRSKGGVRIIYGPNRAYPSTNTQDM